MDLYSPRKHYDNGFTDSARWEHYVPRQGDIVVCTPSKSGTTWMQAIVAHLIFKSNSFPAAVSDMSPWLDLVTVPIEEVVAQLDRQSHRRFIKSHTPLDGLPYYQEVTYIHVARHPLDVLLSMISHMKNLKRELPGHLNADDLEAMFEQWLDVSVGLWAKQGGLSLDYLLHHTKTFWDKRHQGNIHLFHYSSLKKDTKSQMQRLADILEISIEEEHWPVLLQGVSFDNMKTNADQFAPDAAKDSWHSNRDFFKSGRHSEWATRLSDNQIKRYEREVQSLTEPSMRSWVELGETAK